MTAGKLLNVNLTGNYNGALNPRPVNLSPIIVLNLCYRQVNISFLDCPEGLYGSKCSQNCSMTCGDPGRCDIMTGHCNGGCQVGWTGAMCEKGYQLTIYNTHKTSTY